MRTYKSMDRIDFGKHKGLTIDRVANVDGSYIQWMKDSGIIDSDTLTRYHQGEFRNDPLQRGYAIVWTGR